MKTNLVYFDYGNVICTDPDNYFFDYVSNRISKPIERIKEVFLQKISPFVAATISNEEFFKFLAENLETNTEDVAGWFSTVYPSHLKPKPEIIQVVEKIRRKEIRTGILSNIAAPLMQICFDNNYYTGFSPLILSADRHLCKPQIQIYEAALIASGIEDAYLTVFVDDKEKNLVPAKELGIRTVQFNNAHETASDLERKLREAGVEI